jgi:hypothetical protein
MDPKTKPEKTETNNKNPDERVQLSHVWFVNAMDFPGDQMTHIKCDPVPPVNGYTAVWCRADHVIEIRCYRGGVLATNRAMPLMQAKMFEIAA